MKHVEVQRLSVSAPVLKEEIENLPLNQRGIMNLAAVAPGIKSYAPQSGRTLPSGGAAPDLRFFNVYMDGVEMKSLYNGNIVGLGQTGSPLPQEALEQFRVYMNPYDAEYTRAGSYVISAESRRGTNEWQGSAFGFLQNKSFIARNAFQAVRPNFGRTQLASTFAARSPRTSCSIAASYELTSTDFYLDVNPDERRELGAVQGIVPRAEQEPHALHATHLGEQPDRDVRRDGLGALSFDGEGNFGAQGRAERRHLAEVSRSTPASCASGISRRAATS